MNRIAALSAALIAGLALVGGNQAQAGILTTTYKGTVCVGLEAEKATYHALEGTGRAVVKGGQAVEHVGGNALKGAYRATVRTGRFLERIIW